MNAMNAPGARHTVTLATRAKDGLLIGALLAGRTFDEAARAAGVSRRTAYRMRQDPEFQRLYQAAKDELLGAAVASLHSNAQLFIRTLAEVCADPKSRGSERATAADRGLAQLLRSVEVLNLSERIAKLEQVVSEHGN